MENIRSYNIGKYKKGRFFEESDSLVAEEPLEIQINDKPHYFCMRMPGQDLELALGLCFNDGLIASVHDVEGSRLIDDSSRILDLDIPNVEIKGSQEVKVIRSSSGALSSEKLAEFYSQGIQKQDVIHKITPDGIFSLQEDFFNVQDVYEKTGATHAAAVYTHEGERLVFAEDVGRHNALDKCIGTILMNERMADVFCVILSSRLSYEMVSKAARLGGAVVAGVSAPTSLAVDIARIVNMTLVGFLREPRFNVYSAHERILK